MQQQREPSASSSSARGEGGREGGREGGSDDVTLQAECLLNQWEWFYRSYCWEERLDVANKDCEQLKEMVCMSAYG